MFSKHATRDISAYCQGELSSEQSKQFAEHIISCTRCRTKFEEVKLGIRFAEQLPQLSAPDHLWRDLEPLLSHQGIKPARTLWPTQMKVAAVLAVLLLSTMVWWWVYERPRSPAVITETGKPSWFVTRLDGSPKIGAEAIENNGQLGVGEWLETDDKSRAQIAVGAIGNVEIDQNTRVRLVQTVPTEHRLELARGKMSARIWAPPRLFFVDTPSAVAADLGCAYTLEVDDQGSSLLRVTSGWVALELKDRESMVPAGASCETRPGVGPGTPYFEDAPAAFHEALEKIDFDPDATNRHLALTNLLNEARVRDSLTLWHLLSRVDSEDRARVYDRLAGDAPPPAGVTREGVLRLDQKMLDAWKSSLETTWSGNTIKGKFKHIADDYWRVKNGLSRRMKDMMPK